MTKVEYSKNKAIVTLDNAPSGLAPGNCELEGFEIAGADKYRLGDLITPYFHISWATCNPCFCRIELLVGSCNLVYMSCVQELYIQRAGAIYPIYWAYSSCILNNSPFSFTSSHVSVRNGKAAIPNVLRKVMFPT